MSDLDRIDIMRQLRRNGATLQFIADRFDISVQRVAKILALREHASTQRGRPCPQCKGSSHVIRTEQKATYTRRRHECSECLHRWASRQYDE